jgi:hypothetical protein
MAWKDTLFEEADILCRSSTSNGVCTEKYFRYISHWISKNSERRPIPKAFLETHGYLPPTDYSILSRRVTALNLQYQKMVKVPPRWIASTSEVISDFSLLSDIGLSGSRVLPVDDPRWAKLFSKAVADAESRMRQSTGGLGEALAEANQTIDMIASTASRIYRAARAVRKGNFKAAASQLACGVPKGVSKRKAFADNWLAYRYGWTPLLSTVYGTMVANFENQKTRPMVQKVTSQQQGMVILKDYGVSCASSSTLPGLGTHWNRIKSEDQLSVKVTFWYKITNETVANADRLGLADPLSLAWELVPFSFVVDWFVNVGDCISSLTAWNGREFLAGCVAYREMLNESAMGYANSWSSGGQTFTFEPGYASTEHKFYRRVALTTRPFVTPVFSNGLNPKRATDAISLLSQVFK